MSLRGKKVWITGASSGIGLEISRQLIDRGAQVFGSARSLEPLAALSAENERFVPVPLDVTEFDAMERGFQDIVDKSAGLDLAILNAAVYLPGPTRDFSIENLRRHLDVNIMGVANALSLILPHMRARGQGRIAIVASVAGYRGLPQAGVYGATKAALINLAESLRAELEGSGVVLQVVNPGFVDTPMTRKNDFSMPLMISPGRAAGRIIAGLQSNRFEITFPWLFVFWLKMLRLLPYGLYFPLVRRLVRRSET